MDRSRKVTYRAGLLDPRNLTTQQSIEGALAEFGVVLNRENYGAVLAELFRKQHIAALVLSGAFPQSYIMISIANTYYRNQ